MHNFCVAVGRFIIIITNTTMSTADANSSDEEATAAAADAVVDAAAAAAALADAAAALLEAKKVEAKKKPKPPCPSKPTDDQLPTAPPGWRVMRLQRPKCVLNAAFEWEWTFFYYLNNKTHKTQQRLLH